MSAPGERIVRCPSCGGRSVYGPANPFRPFCCAACKGLDLGAWASEQYSIPEQRPPGERGPVGGEEGAGPDPAGLRPD